MISRQLIAFVCLMWLVTACSDRLETPTPLSEPAIQTTAVETQTGIEPTILSINPTLAPTRQTPKNQENSPLSLVVTTTVTQVQFTIPPTAQAVPESDEQSWKLLPVIPEISPKTVSIYERGIELGNNPRAFSKIGDCGSTPAWFLGDFDRGPRFYKLGEYEELDEVIQAFQGSFSRTSLAAKSGFNASSILSPLWANPDQCLPNETPLACEYRTHRPIAAFIMLGSNDVYHPKEFEPQMRKIIEYSIEQGVIPILSTKADNLEGDESINATIARLAVEYDIPLINYWRSLQDLPDKGLQEDQVHITWGPNRFDDPLVMSRGWPVRNLTALQTLFSMWKSIHSESLSQ